MYIKHVHLCKVKVVIHTAVDLLEALGSEPCIRPDARSLVVMFGSSTLLLMSDQAFEKSNEPLS